MRNMTICDEMKRRRLGPISASVGKRRDAAICHSPKGRYEIASKLRFVSFLVMLSLVMFFIGGLVLAKSLAADAATPGQYIMEEIKPGDTLWSLAKKHKEPGQDTRELVYDIKKVNGIDDGNIYPGQLIKVPGHTYAKDSRE